MNRGEDIFEADTNEDRQASAEFLILVLQCIQDWAQMFKTDRHQNDSVFLQTFQELQELGVTFPEFIPFFEDLRDKTPEKSSLNLLECKEMIIEVNKLMSQNSPDRNSIQNKIKWLVNWKTELENSPKKSTDFMAIQELGDDINKSYQIYRYWKKSEAKSPSKMVNLSSQNNEMPQIIHKSYRDVCPKAIPRASTPEIYEINHSEKEKAVSSWEPSPTKSEGIDLDIELDSE